MFSKHLYIYIYILILCKRVPAFCKVHNFLAQSVHVFSHETFYFTCNETFNSPFFLNIFLRKFFMPLFAISFIFVDLFYFRFFGVQFLWNFVMLSLLHISIYFKRMISKFFIFSTLFLSNYLQTIYCSCTRHVWVVRHKVVQYFLHAVISYSASPSIIPMLSILYSHSFLYCALRIDRYYATSPLLSHSVFSLSLSLSLSVAPLAWTILQAFPTPLSSPFLPRPRLLDKITRLVAFIVAIEYGCPVRGMGVNWGANAGLPPVEVGY